MRKQVHLELESGALRHQVIYWRPNLIQLICFLLSILFLFFFSFLFRSEAGSIIKIWIIYEEPLKWMAFRLVKDSRADTKLHFFYPLTIDDTSTVCLENEHMKLKLLEEKYVKYCGRLHWNKHKSVSIIIMMCKNIFVCAYIHKSCFSANNLLMLNRNIIIKGNNCFVDI